jgi:hypothetical protein
MIGEVAGDLVDPRLVSMPVWPQIYRITAV